jgi:hypothetical protein
VNTTEDPSVNTATDAAEPPRKAAAKRPRTDESTVDDQRPQPPAA